MPSKLAFGGLALAATAAVGLAVDLWARRAIGRGEDIDLEQEALPGSRFWVRGVGIHYVEQGRGFPVVLVHGFGASTFSFRYQIRTLAERFRVIAVDLPGFGFSDRGAHNDYSPSAWVELLVEFLGRLGIERAVFVGHSMGGGIVQRLAAAHPELVERLVLVSSVSAAEPPRMPPMLGPVVRVVQAGMATRPSIMSRMMRGVAHDPAFMPGDVSAGYLKPLRVRGNAAALRKLMADARRDRPVDVSTIRVPTLLIWGEHDRTVKPEIGRRLHAAIAGSRLELVQEAAHLPLEEQPQRANALLLDFLADLAEPDSVATVATTANGALP